VGIQPIFRHIIIGVISLAMVVLGLTAIVVIWRKNRQYQFPVLEIPRRLGADYAAGIGGVLSFHDKYGSPSSQRDQIPDYLTQI